MKEDLEHRWRDLGEFIRDQRRVGHLSLRKLSELAGISNPYLSQIERGLRRPSAEILQQIARALRISAESLYIRAGILEPDDEQLTVRDVIGRDERLTAEQKHTLLTVYDSFLAQNEATSAAPTAPGVGGGSSTPSVKASTTSGKASLGSSG